MPFNLQQHNGFIDIPRGLEYVKDISNIEKLNMRSTSPLSFQSPEQFFNGNSGIEMVI